MAIKLKLLLEMFFSQIWSCCFDNLLKQTLDIIKRTAFLMSGRKGGHLT